ncbi:hypothetical protein cyc_04205 [Cyclospora cayetanensis]|uniref:Uncharacterized protein n=1 Tax=Cyclospora cayetanensis TaxID=88456 RepID=A0A1D3CY60_9EIME|nr:hypothetical protein cyc_04205 [Cyclospora cayetanensis]
MKFSASLRLEAVPHLIGITAALQRLTKGGPPGSCCLKLTPRKLFLNTRQPLCELYAELNMVETPHPETPCLTTAAPRSLRLRRFPLESLGKLPSLTAS